MKVFVFGDEVLRQKALPVTEINDNIRNLIQDMFLTMEEQNGIGLAGPQVGSLLRLFIVELEDKIQRVFINPQILATSAETCLYEEGCLSIPKLYAEIERPAKITVQALNEKGRPFSLEADGLLARVIQHEYDHLDGILYIDRGGEALQKKTIESFEKRRLRKLKKETEKAAKSAKIALKQNSKIEKVQPQC